MRVPRALGMLGWRARGKPGNGPHATDLVRGQMAWPTDSRGDRLVTALNRLQVAGWMLALGLYFVVELVATRRMPALPNDLLILMGISVSTYVGLGRRARKR